MLKNDEKRKETYNFYSLYDYCHVCIVMLMLIFKIQRSHFPPPPWIKIKWREKKGLDTVENLSSWGLQMLEKITKSISHSIVCVFFTVQEIEVFYRYLLQMQIWKLRICLACLVRPVLPLLFPSHHLTIRILARTHS